MCDWLGLDLAEWVGVLDQGISDGGWSLWFWVRVDVWASWVWVNEWVVSRFGFGWVCGLVGFG